MPNQQGDKLGVDPTAATIHTIFPAATIKRWCPVPPKLAGKAMDAAVILTGLIDGGALTRTDFLSYGDIAAVMPGKDRAIKPMKPDHFYRSVANLDAWRDHLVAVGLIEASRGVGKRAPARGLRLAEADELPDWLDAAA